MKKILDRMDKYMTKKDLYAAVGLLMGIFLVGIGITILLIQEIAK